jgi:hypothetical protein
MCIADDISMVWKMMWPLVHRNCTNILKELAVSIFKIAQVVGYPEERHVDLYTDTTVLEEPAASTFRVVYEDHTTLIMEAAASSKMLIR